MKFTFSWLKDHLDTTASLDEIETTLSAIGLEVESIEDPAKLLGSFVIARIVQELNARLFEQAIHHLARQRWRRRSVRALARRRSPAGDPARVLGLLRRLAALIATG